MDMRTAPVGHYNAAEDLIGRNLARGDKVAFIDARGSYTFGDVSVGVAKTAAGLGSLGLAPGDRVAICARIKICGRNRQECWPPRTHRPANPKPPAIF